MSLVNTIRNAVNNITQSAPSAPSNPAEAATAVVNAVKDTFQSAPTPQVSLRADANGVRGSAQVGQFTMASFKVGVGGVQFTDAAKNTTGNTTRDGLGWKNEHLGIGVHLTMTEPGATLGAVNVQANGQEGVVGLVPAAPSPLPMPMYFGPTRKRDE